MGSDEGTLPGLLVQLLSCQLCAHMTHTERKRFLSSSFYKATKPVGLESHSYDLI